MSTLILSAFMLQGKTKNKNRIIYLNMNMVLYNELAGWRGRAKLASLAHVATCILSFAIPMWSLQLNILS